MTGTSFTPIGDQTLYTGNRDDGWFRVFTPVNFPITWGGQYYTEIWVSTNSYVLFNNYMSPSIEFYGPFSAANWNYPNNSKIFIGAADNSCQRLNTADKIEDGLRKFIIRYEGASWNGTQNVQGQSDIIWELTFIKDSAYDNKAILEVILNGAITNDNSSYSALCGPSTQLQAFNPVAGTAWLLELGANQSSWAIGSLPYTRKKKLVVSGGLGIMVIGDESLPVGDATFNGGGITDPETYRNQIYFHSNLPYLKVAEFVTIPAITYPALEPDLRTWADPGSGGCGGC
jgi:hypothetical protein